jgi:hypothetical protein
LLGPGLPAHTPPNRFFDQETPVHLHCGHGLPCPYRNDDARIGNGFSGCSESSPQCAGLAAI